MASFTNRVVVIGSVASLACVAAVSGQEPTATPKARVEFRWVESKHVEGLTEDEGVRFSCGPELSYPHRKPVLVPTAADVAAVRLTQHTFAGSRFNYLVTLELTEAARDKLAAACGDQGMRLLTVVVDGTFWGLRRYEKGNAPFVPDAARAETFTPDVGFFSSRAEAERFVDALK